MYEFTATLGKVGELRLDGTPLATLHKVWPVVRSVGSAA